MKTIGIMQPYFFPYLGYWQLLSAVDQYVIYDDVNYIKGGWINRNRILVNGRPQYFNVILDGASPNKKINEIIIGNDERQKKKLLFTIQMNYKKAPFYDDVYPLLESAVAEMNGKLSAFLTGTIRMVSSYLGITTDLILSSALEKDCNLSGQDRVIDICKRLEGEVYINPIGGTELYSKDCFKKNGIDLKFLKMDNIQYRQYDNAFVPGLSIVDVMMFNSKDDINRMLNMYELL